MLIYVVEDDVNIREIECYALRNSGYEVVGFETGEELRDALQNVIPQLIILDIMLPNEDGIEILNWLRENSKTKNLPIMMVTAKSMEMDKVKGLDAGADDYMTKPFGIMEFVSRVKALLRRVVPEEKGDGLSYGSILVEDSKHLVLVDGKPCELTYKEYELLKLLLLNQNIVLSRDKIMERVWGFDFEGETRTVDMHIKTLRQKLGEAASCIKTIRNVGYKIGE